MTNIPKHENYKSVLISKIQDFNNFYMTTSFKEDGQATVALHVVSEDRKHFVEWETKYGAITVMKVFYREEAGALNQEDLNAYGNLIDNYFFERTYGRGMWTQSSVDALELQKNLKEGNFEYIYSSLKDYLPE